MRQSAFGSNAKTNSVGGLNPPNLLRIYTCVIKTTEGKKKPLLTPYVYCKIKSKLAAVSLKACAWRRAHSRLGIHLKWRSSFKHLCVCWFIYLFIYAATSLSLPPCGPLWLNFSEIVLYNSNFGIKVVHVPKIQECTLQDKIFTHLGCVAQQNLFNITCTILQLFGF